MFESVQICVCVHSTPGAIRQVMVCALHSGLRTPF